MNLYVGDAVGIASEAGAKSGSPFADHACFHRAAVASRRQVAAAPKDALIMTRSVTLEAFFQQRRREQQRHDTVTDLISGGRLRMREAQRQMRTGIAREVHCVVEDIERLRLVTATWGSAVQIAAMLLALLLLAAGCAAPISVSRMDQPAAYRALTASALSGNRLSEASRTVLRRGDLLARFDSDSQGAIAALQARVTAGQANQGTLFALAEMSYLVGRQSAQRSYDLAAAVYAFAFLFPGSGQAGPDPFDPRFRQACDLYNLGLTEALTSPDGSQVELRSEREVLPFGTLDIRLDRASLQWGERELVDFVPVAGLQVHGLRNVYRSPGLGAPLAAATQASAPVPGLQVAPQLRVPVTALLLIPNARDQLARGHVHATLAVRSLFDTSSAHIDHQAVPLEYGQTAARALGLSEANVWSREFRGFLFGDLLAETPTTLVALEPHRIGRIPVVFVHGTASSAARWADMLNDLLDDPSIADHFEFWFFSYATGNPIPYSALLLREDLQDAISAMGGTTTDPALGQMVLIGHSQGGLLAKLLVIDTGSRLWDGFSTRPLAELKLTDATRVLLQHTFFLQPLPEVRREIFIATPHRGSYVAGFSISQMVARLVTIPFHVAQAGAEVLTGNRDALQFTPSRGGFGSVYGMTPGSPLIRTLEPIPIVPGVLYNSIIAVQGSGPAESGSDGVVTYESAHLAGAESELVVRSGHSTQSNATTIEEVRRILLEHLRRVAR